MDRFGLNIGENLQATVLELIDIFGLNSYNFETIQGLDNNIFFFTRINGRYSIYVEHNIESIDRPIIYDKYIAILTKKNYWIIF